MGCKCMNCFLGSQYGALFEIILEGESFPQSTTEFNVVIWVASLLIIYLPYILRVFHNRTPIFPVG